MRRRVFLLRSSFFECVPVSTVPFSRTCYIILNCDDWIGIGDRCNFGARSDSENNPRCVFARCLSATIFFLPFFRRKKLAGITPITDNKHTRDDIHFNADNVYVMYSYRFLSPYRHIADSILSLLLLPILINIVDTSMTEKK